jgi:hypothetical protein
MVFEAIISHGDCYPFEDNRIPHEYDLSGKPLLQLEWRSDAELVAKQLGVSNVISIGAIGAYSLLNQGFKKIDLQNNLIDFCRNFNWPESAFLQVKELKEHSSILYFPEHSWVGDVLLHDLTRSNPLFSVNPESITVCLGWGDFISPHTRRVYEKNGVDLTIPIKNKRSKYRHLNPPKYGTRDYYNWYNKEVRRKKD